MFEKITYGPLNFWKFHFDPMRVGKLNLSIYYVHGGFYMEIGSRLRNYNKILQLPKIIIRPPNSRKLPK